jgi:hypothetical protein
MKKLNPVLLIGIWVLLVMIFNILTIPSVFRDSAGTYTTPMNYFIRSVSVMMIGVFILSVLTPFLFFAWFKKHWFINLFFFICSSWYITH